MPERARRHLLLMLALFVFSPAGSAWAQGVAPEDVAVAVVSGRVLRESDGTPVVGATLRCQRPVPGPMFCATGWWSERASTFERVVTDVDGRYRFEFAGGLGLHVIVVLPTEDTGLARVLLPRDAMHQGLLAGARVEVETRVPDATRVVGRVLDEQDAPVPDARVLVWQAGKPFDAERRRIPPDLSVEVDADGGFDLPSVADGAQVEVEAPGHVAPERYTLALAPGLHLDALRPRLHRERFLEGRVVDTTGAPQPWRSVFVRRGPSRDRHPRAEFRGVVTHTRAHALGATDTEGRFRIGPLAQADYEVSVPGGPLLPWSGVAAPDDGALLIELDHGGALAGVVRDPAGHAVAGARVAAITYGGDAGGYATQVTGADGAYAFTGVPPGRAPVLRVEAPGFATQVLDGLAVSALGTNVCDIELEREVVLELLLLTPDGEPATGEGLQLLGDRVVEHRTPPPNAQPGWRAPPLTWDEVLRRDRPRTNRDGRLRLDALYPGVYTLTVASNEQRFELRPGDGPIELRLGARDELRRRLVGRVFNARNGKPLLPDEVRAWRSSSLRVDPDPTEITEGRVLVDLGKTHTQVVVGAKGRAYWSASIPDGPYEDLRRDIPLAEATALTLRVCDAAGERISHAEVRLLRDDTELWYRHDGEPVRRSGRTDRKGKLVARRVPRALITVRVSGLRPGRRTKFVQELELDLREAGERAELDVVVE